MSHHLRVIKCILIISVHQFWHWYRYEYTICVEDNHWSWDFLGTIRKLRINRAPYYRKKAVFFSPISSQHLLSAFTLYESSDLPMSRLQNSINCVPWTPHHLAQPQHRGVTARIPGVRSHPAKAARDLHQHNQPRFVYEMELKMKWFCLEAIWIKIFWTK